MPDRGYKYRKEWNAANYKQIKADVPPELADEFRAACTASGEPVRQVLLRLISGYARAPQNAKKAVRIEPDYSTRGKRRKAAAEILDQLTELLEAEEAYRDNIPENLQGSIRYEAAEQAVESLTEAVSALEGAFTEE